MKSDYSEAFQTTEFHIFNHGKGTNINRCLKLGYSEVSQKINSQNFLQPCRRYDETIQFHTHAHTRTHTQIQIHARAYTRMLFLYLWLALRLLKTKVCRYPKTCSAVCAV